MKLFGYFRSSAAYRVRIALALKGLPHDNEFVHLRRAEHRAESFLGVTPQGLVPALEDGGALLTQSLAIMEYLDETRPEPPLLPKDAIGRARVRAIAQAIACDIHPLNNLRVLQHLAKALGQDPRGVETWYNHWIHTGFTAIEAMLSRDPATGRFCHGDTPGLADACLVPQAFNARRYQTDLSAYPTILRIEAACDALPAFQAAHPRNQPDFEP